MESILTTIKKMLGITEEYEQFDQDIIIHINSVFMILAQLGVGPTNGFAIVDKNATWSDFIPEDQQIEAVKSYMFMKVKMMFDPPQSSIVAESYNRLISETEWRLHVSVDK